MLRCPCTNYCMSRSPCTLYNLLFVLLYIVQVCVCYVLVLYLCSLCRFTNAVDFEDGMFILGINSCDISR